MEITSETIKRLLYEDEGTTLDFKRSQYQFGGTDEQKSELLKDILAFTNAWRRADAFILIGIEEVPGGTHRVIGISQHLMDSDLQQFVNSKTQRPIEFHYRTVKFENVSLGVIHIPVQPRPVSLRQDYGKLRRNVVYIRRGSSTAEAAPEEVAQMGHLPAAESPRIIVSFFDPTDNRVVGSEISVELTDLRLPPQDEIGDYTSAQATELGTFRVHIPNPSDNAEFYREYSKYLCDSTGLAPLNIVAINDSGAVAQDVKVEFSVEHINGLRIQECAPVPPARNRLFGSLTLPRALNVAAPNCSVRSTSKAFDVLCNFGKIQPKSKVLFADAFHIGSTETKVVPITGRICADNLSNPLDFSLSVTINVQKRELTLEELFDVADSAE